MKRFYDKSLNALKGINKELADDINSYVLFLEHIQAVLVAELGLSATPSGNDLLRRLGYKINDTKGKGKINNN